VLKGQNESNLDQQPMQGLRQGFGLGVLVSLTTAVFSMTFCTFSAWWFHNHHLNPSNAQDYEGVSVKMNFSGLLTIDTSFSAGKMKSLYFVGKVFWHFQRACCPVFSCYASCIQKRTRAVELLEPSLAGPYMT
jgi:hypothetical protein